MPGSIDGALEGVPRRGLRLIERHHWAWFAAILGFGAVLLFLWYTGSPGLSSSAPAATDTTASGTRAAANTPEPEFLEWSGSSDGGQPALQKKLEGGRKAVADSPKDGNALRTAASTWCSAI